MFNNVKTRWIYAREQMLGGLDCLPIRFQVETFRCFDIEENLQNRIRVKSDRKVRDPSQKSHFGNLLALIITPSHIIDIRGNHRNRGRFSRERGGCFGGRALRRALRTMVAPSARASSASSTQDATPYEQPHHYRTRHPAAAPTSKTRQRTSVAREVERVNAHIERRLRELKREPPARFHAPDADASLRPKALRGPKGPRAPDRATTLSRRPTWDDGSGASRDARASSSRTSAARARARRPARGRPGAVTSRVPPSPKSIRSPWTTPPSAVASRTSTAPAVTPSWSARVGADPSTVSPCGPSDSASTTRDHPRASPTSIPRPGSASARAFRSPSESRGAPPRVSTRTSALTVIPSASTRTCPDSSTASSGTTISPRWTPPCSAPSSITTSRERRIRSGARLGAPRDRRGSRGW